MPHFRGRKEVQPPPQVTRYLKMIARHGYPQPSPSAPVPNKMFTGRNLCLPRRCYTFACTHIFCQRVAASETNIRTTCCIGDEDTSWVMFDASTRRNTQSKRRSMELKNLAHEWVFGPSCTCSLRLLRNHTRAKRAGRRRSGAKRGSPSARNSSGCASRPQHHLSPCHGFFSSRPVDREIQ